MHERADRRCNNRRERYRTVKIRSRGGIPNRSCADVQYKPGDSTCYICICFGLEVDVGCLPMGSGTEGGQADDEKVWVPRSVREGERARGEAGM